MEGVYVSKVNDKSILCFVYLEYVLSLILVLKEVSSKLEV